MKTAITAGTLLVSAFLMQMPAKPPIKMGLWESTTTMKMTMPDMPAGMPGMGSPRTTKTRSCMTPESYAKNLAASQQKDCTRTNEVWSGDKFSFDVSCPSRNAKGHFEMNLSNSDAGHGTMHLDMSPGGRPMTMDMTIDTHFISADCGSVSADKPEVVR